MNKTCRKCGITNDSSKFAPLASGAGAICNTCDNDLDTITVYPGDINGELTTRTEADYSDNSKPYSIPAGCDSSIKCGGRLDAADCVWNGNCPKNSKPSQADHIAALQLQISGLEGKLETERHYNAKAERGLKEELALKFTQMNQMELDYNAKLAKIDALESAALVSTKANLVLVDELNSEVVRLGDLTVVRLAKIDELNAEVNKANQSVLQSEIDNDKLSTTSAKFLIDLNKAERKIDELRSIATVREERLAEFNSDEYLNRIAKERNDLQVESYQQGFASGVKDLNRQSTIDQMVIERDKRSKIGNLMAACLRDLDLHTHFSRSNVQNRISQCRTEVAEVAYGECKRPIF